MSLRAQKQSRYDLDLLPNDILISQLIIDPCEKVVAP